MNLKPPKIWKRFDEQLTLLQERGLVISDENMASKYLKTVGYYRLSGYMYPFVSPIRATASKKRTTFFQAAALKM